MASSSSAQHHGPYPRMQRQFVIPDPSTTGGDDDDGGLSYRGGTGVWDDKGNVNGKIGAHGSHRAGTITTSHPTPDSILDDDFRASKRVLYRSPITGKKGKSKGGTNSMFTSAGGAAVGIGSTGPIADEFVGSPRIRISVPSGGVAAASPANNQQKKGDGGDEDEDAGEQWMFVGPADLDFGEVKDAPDTSVLKSMLVDRAISRNKVMGGVGGSGGLQQQQQQGAGGSGSNSSTVPSFVPTPTIVAGSSASDMISTSACALCGVIYSKKALRFRTTAKHVHDQRQKWSTTIRKAEEAALKIAKKNGAIVGSGAVTLASTELNSQQMDAREAHAMQQKYQQQRSNSVMTDGATSLLGSGSGFLAMSQASPRYAGPTENTNASQVVTLTNASNSNIIPAAQVTADGAIIHPNSTLYTGGAGGGGFGSVVPASKLASSHMYSDVTVCVFCAQFCDQYETGGGDTAVASVNQQMIADTRHLSHNVERRIRHIKADARKEEERHERRKRVFERTGHYPSSSEEEDDGPFSDGEDNPSYLSGDGEIDGSSRDTSRGRSDASFGAKKGAATTAPPAKSKLSTTHHVVTSPISTNGPTNAPSPVLSHSGGRGGGNNNNTPQQQRNALVAVATPEAAEMMTVDTSDAQTALNAILSQMVLVSKQPPLNSNNITYNTTNSSSAHNSHANSMRGGGEYTDSFATGTATTSLHPSPLQPSASAAVVGGGHRSPKAATSAVHGGPHRRDDILTSATSTYGNDPFESDDEEEGSHSQGTHHHHHSSRTSTKRNTPKQATHSPPNASVKPLSSTALALNATTTTAHNSMNNTARSSSSSPPDHHDGGGDDSIGASPIHKQGHHDGAPSSGSPLQRTHTSAGRQQHHLHGEQPNKSLFMMTAAPHSNAAVVTSASQEVAAMERRRAAERNRHALLRNKFIADAMKGQHLLVNSGVGQNGARHSSSLHHPQQQQYSDPFTSPRMRPASATGRPPSAAGGGAATAAALRSRSALMSQVRSSGYGTSHYDPSEAASSPKRFKSVTQQERDRAVPIRHSDDKHRRHPNDGQPLYNVTSGAAAMAMASAAAASHHRNNNSAHGTPVASPSRTVAAIMRQRRGEGGDDNGASISSTSTSGQQQQQQQQHTSYHERHQYVPTGAAARATYMEFRAVNPNVFESAGGSDYHNGGRGGGNKPTGYMANPYGGNSGGGRTPPSGAGRLRPSSAGVRRSAAKSGSSSRQPEDHGDVSTRLNLRGPREGQNDDDDEGNGMHDGQQQQRRARSVSPSHASHRNTNASSTGHAASTARMLREMRTSHDEYNDELVQRRKDRQAFVDAEVARLNEEAAEREAAAKAAAAAKKEAARQRAEAKRQRELERARRVAEQEAEEEEERRRRALRRVQIVEPPPAPRKATPKRQATPPRAVDPPPPPPVVAVVPVVVAPQQPKPVVIPSTSQPAAAKGIPQPKKFVPKNTRGTVSTDDGGYMFRF